MYSIVSSKVFLKQKENFYTKERNFHKPLQISGLALHNSRLTARVFHLSILLKYVLVIYLEKTESYKCECLICTLLLYCLVCDPRELTRMFLISLLSFILYHKYALLQSVVLFNAKGQSKNHFFNRFLSNIIITQFRTPEITCTICYY